MELEGSTGHQGGKYSVEPASTSVEVVGASRGKEPGVRLNRDKVMDGNVARCGSHRTRKECNQVIINKEPRQG